MISQGRGGRIISKKHFPYLVLPAKIQCRCSMAGKKVRRNDLSHFQTWCDVLSTGFPAYAAYSSTRFFVRAMTQSAGKIELAYPLTQAIFLIVALICEQLLILESTESPSTFTAREPLTHLCVRRRPTYICECLFLTFGNQVHNMIPIRGKCRCRSRSRQEAGKYSSL